MRSDLLLYHGHRVRIVTALQGQTNGDASHRIAEFEVIARAVFVIVVAGHTCGRNHDIRVDCREELLSTELLFGIIWLRLLRNCRETMCFHFGLWSVFLVDWPERQEGVTKDVRFLRGHLGSHTKHLRWEGKCLVIFPMFARLDEVLFIVQAIDHCACVDGSVGFHDDVERVGHCLGCDDGCGVPRGLTAAAADEHGGQTTAQYENADRVICHDHSPFSKGFWVWFLASASYAVCVAWPCRCSQYGRWAAVEIPLDESGIGEGVDQKREAVVVHADVADHFLIGPQVRILVMLDENPLRTSLPVCLSR